MVRDDGERFLSRWSRLKKEVRRAEKQTDSRPPEPKAAAASPAAAPAVSAKETTAGVGAQPQSPVELPPIDSLKGLASEYTEFLKPGVDESLRRSALKKLFKDPYFETFERFEAYCEDYTKGEPIPAAMLKTLEHAKGLLFDEQKEEEKEGQRSAAEGGQSQAGIPAQDEAKVEAPAAPPQPEEKKA
jgi:uncharacterized protein DUF3306